MVKVGFSTSTKCFAVGAALIRWYMGTPFSHTYLVFVDEIGEQVYHATGTGLYPISREKFLSYNKVVAEYDLSVDGAAELKLKQLALKEAGSKYGFWQNLGLILVRLFRLQVNPFQDGVNCSEWVAEALKSVDLEAFSDFKDLNLVEPIHVYSYMEQKHAKTA